MEKPKIGVINSSSELSICYAHLDDVSRVVKEAIRAAGGLPFEIRTIAPSDFVTSAGKKGRYLMPSRDLLVNDIEVMVEGAVLDGMVLLSSCDKTTPAHLMAAARMNIPSIVVACGYQVGKSCGGQTIDIDDVYEAVGAVAAGKMALAELARMADSAIQGPGVCAGLGTANSMHCMAEALGMALTGSSPVRAGSDRMFAFAKRAGHRSVELVEENLLPRAILTEDALYNATLVALSIGASVNTFRHLAAIAAETELNVDVIALAERLAPVGSLVIGVRPNGPYTTSDFERAGGCRAVMSRFRSDLRLNTMNVEGVALGQALPSEDEGDREVIRSPRDPYKKRPGVVVLRGNLAPAGALVKFAAVAEGQERFTGPASVFEDEDDALAALVDGQIKPGAVVVLRQLGPRGGPGTVFAASFVAALNGAALAEDIAVVTDGELSGLNRGLVVGPVMPEAADGGPLAAVYDGDLIDIDISARAINVRLEEKELERRLAHWHPRESAERGWLAQYRILVQPLEEGATLNVDSSKRRRG